MKQEETYHGNGEMHCLQKEIAEGSSRNQFYYSSWNKQSANLQGVQKRKSTVI